MTPARVNGAFGTEILEYFLPFWNIENGRKLSWPKKLCPTMQDSSVFKGWHRLKKPPLINRQRCIASMLYNRIIYSY